MPSGVHESRFYADGVIEFQPGVVATQEPDEITVITTLEVLAK